MFRNVCISSILEHHIFPQIRTQNIPKALFLQGSGMFFFQAFWKSTILSRSEQIIPKPFFGGGGSGMFVSQAFWNSTISPRSEHKSFLKHCFWGVPECLFLKHSKTTQFPLDQNKNHSQNIVFGGFQNVCFSSISEHYNFPQIRTQIIPKTLF